MHIFKYAVIKYVSSQNIKMQTCKKACLPVCKSAMQVHKYIGIRVFRYASIKVCKFVNLHVCVCKYVSMLIACENWFTSDPVVYLAITCNQSPVLYVS